MFPSKTSKQASKVPMGVPSCLQAQAWEREEGVEGDRMSNRKHSRSFHGVQTPWVQRGGSAQGKEASRLLLQAPGQCSKSIRHWENFTQRTQTWVGHLALPALSHLCRSFYLSSGPWSPDSGQTLLNTGSSSSTKKKQMNQTGLPLGKRMYRSRFGLEPKLSTRDDRAHK